MTALVITANRAGRAPLGHLAAALAIVDGLEAVAVNSPPGPCSRAGPVALGEPRFQLIFSIAPDSHTQRTAAPTSNCTV